jgi:hypothetical protein
MVGSQVGTNAEILAELAREVAEVARSRPTTPPWPAQMDGIVAEMAQECVTMLATVAAGLESTDPAPARDVQRTRAPASISAWWRRVCCVAPSTRLRWPVTWRGCAAPAR